jgi:hypothetical protein
MEPVEAATGSRVGEDDDGGSLAWDYQISGDGASMGYRDMHLLMKDGHGNFFLKLFFVRRPVYETDHAAG